MTQRPGVRRTPAARPSGRRPVAARPRRRTPTVRRASAGLTPVRAGAILAVLVSGAAVYGMANSTAFDYARLRLEGATFTATSDVEAALEGVRGANLFQLRTGPLATAIADLQTVRAASVRVALPDTLVVRIDEREPILVWRVGAREYLVDDEGQLFALLGEDPPPGVDDLPVIEDRRAASAGLSVGRSVAASDLDAATRLASLVPADVGSAAAGLDVVVSDVNGFSIASRPADWYAVFGYYTPSLRTTELIPGQVRLLRSLLLGREGLIERIVLASETDGTYVPKPTPSPVANPSPAP
ncbi:MAG TPA: FtsQ-type POTRA domain-containing protein [Candidatus Limnocylindrales bacterium]